MRARTPSFPPIIADFDDGSGAAGSPAPMRPRDILLQIGQVAAVLLLAPLIQGIILQFEERVQRARGPGVFQPYRDLWKLFHKADRRAADRVMAVLGDARWWRLPAC